MKLATITDKYSGSESSLEVVSRALGRIAGEFKKMVPREFKKPQYLLLETSSPTQTVSWMGMVSDYLLLKKFGL